MSHPPLHIPRHERQSSHSLWRRALRLTCPSF